MSHGKLTWEANWKWQYDQCGYQSLLSDEVILGLIDYYMILINGKTVTHRTVQCEINSKKGGMLFYISDYI